MKSEVDDHSLPVAEGSKIQTVLGGLRRGILGNVGSDLQLNEGGEE